MEAKDLAVFLAGIKLEHPLFNAAGTCSTLLKVKEFARSPVSVIHIGPITVKARQENEGNTFDAHYNENGSLAFTVNSRGLPNGGIPYFEKYLPKMVSVARAAGKRVGVSIAGISSPKEFEQLLFFVLPYYIDFVVLNFGCPNVWDGGTHGTIMSYDKDFLEEALILVDECLQLYATIFHDHTQIFAKLSPFSDSLHDREGLKDIVRLVASHKSIAGLVLTNTRPDYVHCDKNGKPVITVPGSGGRAGLGGPALKKDALRAVRIARALADDPFEIAVPKHLSIIGVGGVMSGADVWEFQNAGADAVKVASAYFTAGENVKVYERILSEYVEECEKRGLPRQSLLTG